jgi:hypothetical protein
MPEGFRAVTIPHPQLSRELRFTQLADPLAIEDQLDPMRRPRLKILVPLGFARLVVVRQAKFLPVHRNRLGTANPLAIDPQQQAIDFVDPLLARADCADQVRDLCLGQRISTSMRRVRGAGPRQDDSTQSSKHTAPPDSDCHGILQGTYHNMSASACRLDNVPESQAAFQPRCR